MFWSSYLWRLFSEKLCFNSFSWKRSNLFPVWFNLNIQVCFLFLLSQRTQFANYFLIKGNLTCDICEGRAATTIFEACTFKFKKSTLGGPSAINYLQGKMHDASFNMCSHFRVQNLQMSCPLKFKSNWSGCTTRHRGNEAVCHRNRLKWHTVQHVGELIDPFTQEEATVSFCLIKLSQKVQHCLLPTSNIIPLHNLNLSS